MAASGDGDRGCGLWVFCDPSGVERFIIAVYGVVGCVCVHNLQAQGETTHYSSTHQLTTHHPHASCPVTVQKRSDFFGETKAGSHLPVRVPVGFYHHQHARWANRLLALSPDAHNPLVRRSATQGHLQAPQVVFSGKELPSSLEKSRSAFSNRVGKILSTVSEIQQARLAIGAIPHRRNRDKKLKLR